MRRLSRTRRGLSLVAGLTVALLAWSATAQQGGRIELRAVDGSFTMPGQLLSITDGVYLIDADGLGEMRIEAALVECFGAACGGATTEPKFGIHGSRTVGTTLIPNLLERYAAVIGARFEIEPTDDPAARIVRLVNPDGSLRVEIDLQTRGSGSAFRALADRKAVIGLADRRMKDSDLEKALAPAGIPELRDTENEIVLGVDGIALITHPQNKISQLTADQVARIFSGEITNWSQLGGAAGPISVNSFGEGSGDRAVVLDALVRPRDRDETAQVTRWSAYQDMVNAVIADRGGFGYVGRWLARTNNAKLLTIEEDCGLFSPPSDFRMKIEGYALSRRLYAYKRPGPLHPEARAFLDWAVSDAAQPVIKNSYFVDRDLERMRLEDMTFTLLHTAEMEDFDANLHRRLTQELRVAERLSLSFRFVFNSSRLDVEAVRNVRTFAQRLDQGELDGYEVLFVGFSDSIGDPGGNQALSLKRAKQAQTALLNAVSPETASRLRSSALGFGELMPLSCNSDSAGRARNRRVEVWLRR